MKELRLDEVVIAVLDDENAEVLRQMAAQGPAFLDNVRPSQIERPVRTHESFGWENVDGRYWQAWRVHEEQPLVVSLALRFCRTRVFVEKV